MTSSSRVTMSWTARTDLVLAGALLSAAALWALHWHQWQFGGYDLSPLIDLFWRVKQGQVPGQDFPCTWPPAVAWLAKAVAPWTPSWSHLAALNVLLTVAAMAALAVLHRGQRPVAAASVLALVLALPLLYSNHLWHSTMAQLAAVMFLHALAQATWLGAADRRGLTGLALCAAWLVLQKQNVAFPALLMTLVWLGLDPRLARARLLLAVLGGVLAGVLADLWLMGRDWSDWWSLYASVKGRASPSAAQWMEIWQGSSNALVLTGVLVALAAAAATCRPRAGWPQVRTCWAGVGLVLSLLPLWTDWDAKIHNAPLPLYVTACWLWLAASGAQADGRPADRLRTARVAWGCVTAVLAASALSGGASRERMEGVGPLAFFQLPADRQLHEGYFDGLHTGERMERVVAEMRQLRRVLPQGTVFMGPRIEFGYGMLGLPSPRGLPLWWHPGSAYGLADEPAIMEAFLAHRFDVLVFLHNDRTRMPRALLEKLAPAYVRLDGPQALDVFVRVDRSGGVPSTGGQDPALR